MKIKSLKLRGFIGIKAGMGLDEISIDLSNLDGLIALAGQNGKGKTTILDNLHPYRTLPSRNKALQHHVFLRDSFREIVFEFEGNEYRSLIKIDSDSERSEAFIWKNGISEVDGKVKNYDQYIVNLLGSQSLFFNSVFCAQGSQKLSDMTTGDLKKLFAEFLKLDTLVEYEKTANQAASILAQKNAKRESEIANLKTQISCAEDLGESIASASEKVRSAERDLTTLNADLVKAETDIEKYWKAASANEVLRHRQRDMEASIRAIKDDLKNDLRQFESDKLAISLKIAKETESKMAASELCANETAILEAVRQSDELADRIKETTLSADNIRTYLAEVDQQLRGYEQELFTLRSKEKELIADPTAKLLKQEIKTLQGKTGDLEKKDPECVSTTCSFIVGALEAQKQLPGLQERLAELQKSLDNDVEKLRCQIAKQEANITALETLKSSKTAEYEQLQRELKTDQAEFDRIMALAKQKSGLDVAKEKLKTADTRVAELESEINRISDVCKTKEAANLQRIKGLEEQLQEMVKEIDPGIGPKVQAGEARIRQLKAEIASTSKAITDLQSEVLRLERTREETLKKQQELSSIETAQNASLQELSEWQYLKAACSKDGLRALEIDSVAPLVSGYANDLLTASFAPGYSIQFRTLDEETGRELLDILILRDDGSEVLLDNLSGGEKVWCLKALRLAMTLIAKEKFGKNIETALSDEEDGALDGGNARNFISLYRAFAQAGGFRSCFYISHKPECVAMADHVLMFGDKGVTIQ